MGANGIFAASFVNLRSKPKFKRLVRATGLYEATIKGALQFLWEYGVDVCTSGKLDLDPEDIPDVLGLPDDIAQIVFDAMIDAKFIDRTEDGLVIHDWDENKSPYMRRLERDRTRKARYLTKAKNSERSSHVETKRNEINEINEIRDKSHEGGDENQNENAHDIAGMIAETMTGETKQTVSEDHMAEVKAFQERLREMIIEHKI